MKLKRIENNHNYIVDVNNSDNIYALKNKLSRVTKLNCNKISLIHKNRVLKNDKLITDYNIDDNDFVLFGDEEIDYCRDNELNRKNYFEKYCTFCYGRINERKNDKVKQLNDDEKISVIIKMTNSPLLSINTNRNQKIRDGLKGRFFDLNGLDEVDKTCSCIRYLEFMYQVPLDLDKTFGDYGIEYGGIIHVLKSIKGGAPGSASMVMNCITGHYDKFEISFSSEISKIFNEISNKINIPQKNIKLFQDKNQSKPIKSNIDRPFLRDGVGGYQEDTTDKSEIDIYYIIKTDFDNLVKLEKLGTGSFGTVFKCVSIETKKVIAVKKLKIPTTDDAKEDKLSFERELQVYSKHSDHPRIVKYERNFQTENAIFLVMEYMKGGSLGIYLKKNGPLSEDKIKKYSKQILEALQYLHEQQILHRDIKSDNILLDEDDNVKLCDFGLSKILTDLATKDFLNGVKQSSVGTANYMAPEILNDEPYGASADVWSFGATMVEMVTGFPPYHQMSYFSIINLISKSRKIDYNYPNNLSDD